MKKIGETAYQLRQQGYTWQSIGDSLDTTKNSASICARLYAKNNDLPWPALDQTVEPDMSKLVKTR